MDRMAVAGPFVICQLFLVIGESLDGGNLFGGQDCTAKNVFLEVAEVGFCLLLALSFFAFFPWLRWLMRSPIILQFQMLCMHRHRAPRPPPYVYLSDGGLIEVSGTLTLLRRRVRTIICSDACEDPDVSLRALSDLMVLARKEHLCSFFDPADARRNIELSIGDWANGRQPFFRVGICYEPSGGAASESQDRIIGELLFVRMRLPPGDNAIVRPLLTETELLASPQPPHGTAFDLENPADAPVAQVEMRTGPPQHATLGDSLQTTVGSGVFPENGAATQKLRTELDGSCCLSSCGCVGRRFPAFSVSNQCLLPIHFANLCALGAEVALPAVRHAKCFQGASCTDSRTNAQ